VNLVIDIGNTLVKTAIFQKKELKGFSAFEKISITGLKKIIADYPGIKNAILSSVANHDASIHTYLKSNFCFIEFTHVTKIPIQNLYRSPVSLGKDRLASAIGANMLFPDQNILAVDAGTCIKYDFVNAKNQYLGGAISPGIEMRFKALHEFTDKLPLLNYRPFEHLIGQDTDESILSGVMNGVKEEVRGVIRQYEKQYPELKIVFTGGYLKFFERIFNIGTNGKSNIFADSFLVLKGLNEILLFNEKI